MTVLLRGKMITAGACLVCSLAVHAKVGGNAQAIEEVLSGQRTVAHASWWGFNSEDATASVQGAIDSGARKVVLGKMSCPWIVRPIRLAGNQEFLLKDGVILQAKRGEFRGRGDSLLTASAVENVSVHGYGATLRMWRQDYDKPPYEKAEWRHALSIRSCSNVRIMGLTITESGGDGIYLGVSRKSVSNTDVVIKDVVCDRNYRQGISVISAQNLLIENTIMRDTGGTPPAAGIDFEPNYQSEKLSHCILRNCRVENNDGDGFVFYLKNMNEASSHDLYPPGELPIGRESLRVSIHYRQRRRQLVCGRQGRSDP